MILLFFSIVQAFSGCHIKMDAYVFLMGLGDL
jgi:hypothetical protein